LAQPVLQALLARRAIPVLQAPRAIEFTVSPHGFEGIVSKRLGSRYVSGRSPDWLKMKNPDAPAVKREVEDDWCRRGWR
jgi:ATP-dependent DNA ligase